MVRVPVAQFITLQHFARRDRSYERCLTCQLGYLHDSARAVAIAKQWLAPGGLLGDVRRGLRREPPGSLRCGARSRKGDGAETRLEAMTAGFNRGAADLRTLEVQHRGMRRRRRSSWSVGSAPETHV